MPKFEDLDAFLDETLRLPIKGTEYVIPPLSGRDGLRAQRMMDLALQVALEQDRPVDPDKPAPPTRSAAGLELDDEDERDFYQLVLSQGVLELMLADGVTWPSIQRAAQTAFLWNTAGEEAAMKRWQEGSTPKARSPRSSGTAPSRKKAGRSGSKASHKAAKKAATSSGPGSSSTGP